MPWLNPCRGRMQVLPHALFEKLSPAGQAACRELALPPGEELAESGYRDGFG